jgi:hypothetical protein
MMHDYQNRGLADGAVRKSNKTKGEFCEEARIAVRKRLKTKEGDFAGGGFFGRWWSLRRAWLAREGAPMGAVAFAMRQQSGAERAADQESCETIAQNWFPCQLFY